MSRVTIDAPAFDPLMQNQRPALALANGRIYVGYASHCDKQPYRGILFAFDVSSLKQRGLFNTSPGGDGASIWQSGQAPAFDEDGNILVVTGNGSSNGTTNWSESFLRLDPDLKLLDWFTPTHYEQLDKVDNDLDSSGATLIPGTRLVLGGGKEKVLYSFDAQHWASGRRARVATLSSGGLSSAQPRLLEERKQRWNALHMGAMGPREGSCGKARRIATIPFMSRPEKNEGHPGAMLSLSANGSRDGILWAAIHVTGDSWHESRPGILHAYDADDISHKLWNSSQIPAHDDCNNHFQNGDDDDRKRKGLSFQLRD
jgi:hypothetical protein